VILVRAAKGEKGKTFTRKLTDQSDHPQLRTQGLPELLEQNAPDHPAAEVYAQ
jgi:hypothetical protein